MKTNLLNSAKLVKVLIFTLFIGTVSCAQPPGGGQQGGQQGPPPIPDAKQINTMVSSMAKEISLTGKQEASVLKLYTEHFEKVKAMTSGNAKPKREEMDALKKDLEKNVKALLTADQQKAYSAYLKKQNSQRPPKER